MDKREGIPPLYDIVISMAQEIRRTSSSVLCVVCENMCVGCGVVKGIDLNLNPGLI